MRKALATLGVLAVLLFASAAMTGCESDDDGGDDSGSDPDTTTSPDGIWSSETKSTSGN